MKFLAPIGGKTTAYGIITAPNHKGIPHDIKYTQKPWAADLGCLVGPDYVKKMDFNIIFDWLYEMKPYRDRCLFLAGFDVVGDALGTLEAFAEFNHYFIDWPLAYIAQNGSESLPFPESAKAIFIGGTTSWKISMSAVNVIKRAQAKNMHIHIGRVNYGRRYRLFRVLTGSNQFTCDGTRTRYDGVSKTLRAWHGYEAQPPLFTI